MRKLGILVLSVMIAAAASAQEPDHAASTAAAKPAWQWTLEERIAKRLDRDSIRKRAEASDKDGATPQELSTANVFLSPSRFVIEGKRDPALLMPFELFGSLQTGVSDEPGRGLRRLYRDKIRETGWNEELFWKVIADASAEYFRVLNEKHAVRRQARSLPEAERTPLTTAAEALDVTSCRLRKEAQDAVRQQLGPEKFDRFLYEHVAPNVGIGSDFPYGNEEWRLKYVEGGCQ